MDIMSRFVPRDRQVALASGLELPHAAQGAVLFADISGFTPLTEALSAQFGPLRAAEEMTRHLDAALDPLIRLVHGYGGTVTGFVGDAITAWFDGDDGRRATACALAQQAASPASGLGSLPGGARLTLKAAVAAGPVRRFLVGDPALHQIEVLAGSTLTRVAAAEQQARPGEVVLDPATAAALGAALTIAARRGPAGWAVVTALADAPAVASGVAFPQLAGAITRPWLAPEIAARIAGGPAALLAELRPVVPLFLRFGGLDYDADPTAPAQLDAFIRWIQHILAPHQARILALAIGDKGSFLHTAFGAPAAHEDDAQRAIAVALALRTPPAECLAIPPPSLGLTRGRAWAGLYGGAQRGTYDIMGPPVNLACRLMEQAAPGQVLVSAELAAAVSGSFRVAPRGSAVLKGVAGPVALYEVEAPQAQAALPEIASRGPLIGRAVELAQLQGHLNGVRLGRGRVVLVSGEAGIGKSRLVAEAAAVARRAGFGVYGGAARATGEQTPYLAWRAIWWSLFDLRPTASLLDQLARVTATVAEVAPERSAYVPLLAPVLDLPLPLPAELADLDDKQRKETRESLLAACLRGLVLRAERPVLLVLEDAHWLDPLSRSLLDVLAAAAADLPLLLLLTSRPAAEPGAAKLDRAPAAELLLGPLAEDEVAALIAGRLPAQRRAGAAVQAIAARTSGNPLYVEELVAHLLEQGIDTTDPTALAQADVPPTLQRLVLSRLDQLPEAQKTVLKVASVLGQEFQVDWLVGYYPAVGAAAAVQAAMTALRAHEMVVDGGSEAAHGYRFRHNLIQEAIYGSLPQALRGTLHGDFAAWLEGAPVVTPGRLDVLAYHYGRSSNADKQREYFRKAGDAALAAYANSAAAAYFARLLPLLPGDEQAPVLIAAGETWERTGAWEQAADRYSAALPQPAAARGLGVVRQKQGRWDEAIRSLEQAHEGYVAAGDLAGQGRALAELGNLYRARGNLPQAQTLLREAAALAQAAGDIRTQALALNYLGTVYSFLRDHQQALALYGEALALRRTIGDRPGISASLNNLGLAAYEMHAIAEALALHQESLAIKRELGDRSGVANALNNLGLVAWRREDYAQGRAYYLESLAIKRELGDRPGAAVTMSNLALVGYSEGAFAAGQDWSEQGLALSRAVGDRSGEARALGILSLNLAAQGHAATARLRLHEGLTICHEIGANMITELLLNWSIGQVDPLLSARLLGMYKADPSADEHSPCLGYIFQIHVRGAAAARRALGAPDYQLVYAAARTLDQTSALAETLAALVPA